MALAERAAALEQPRDLRRLLHALGDALDPEGRREADERADEARLSGRVEEPVDERLRDLERVEREGGEPFERRAAGAEVVEDELDAERAQLVHAEMRRVEVPHDVALGDLEPEVLGRK